MHHSALMGRLKIVFSVTFHRDPDPVPALAIVLILARARRPYRVVFLIGPAILASVAHAAEQALFVPAPDSIAALRGRAAGNGNSAFEAPAAHLVGDTYRLDTVAGSQAEEQVSGQSRGPICPNRFYAVPNKVPSDLPNVVAHQTATRGSTQEAGGNSAQGYAGRTPAQSLDLQATRGRCTRNSRTSYHSGRPSTYRRKSRSLLPEVARSKPGNPAPGRVPGRTEG